ncbi:MAG TPA: DUF4058 family protein [Tepidisphaeraceae bacterium]|nr:DUF4058 family protein [Tepidisphaeraceae bacterium]
MPIHDWKRLDPGIFHAFHLSWILEVSRRLNEGILPEHYYALPEQHVGRIGPIASAIGSHARDEDLRAPNTKDADLFVAEPQLAVTAETDLGFYRRKQMAIAIRHVSGDQIAAMIEIVSPGNKSSRSAIRAFIEKTSYLLDKGIHLLIVDVLPPGPRDPHGIHAAIWDDVAGQEYVPPAGKPFTLAAYETALSIRCYVQPFGFGEALVEMPLFLRPNGCVQAPLERTYTAAFAAMPRRWKRVLEAPA